ncbi:MAG: MATE family efflux transporter [Chlamydiota bacterium]|nr:MATE family efflux transporter [Chlamydiota bacterium]
MPQSQNKYLSDLLNKNNHIEVMSIAIPMILSNITVPLLGLVDATVIGHLEHASYLGGVAIGGTMINVILWLFGFLRMATTGVTAQAYGAKDKKKTGENTPTGVDNSASILDSHFSCQ